MLAIAVCNQAAYTMLMTQIEGSILLPPRTRRLSGSSGTACALAFQNSIGNASPR